MVDSAGGPPEGTPYRATADELRSLIQAAIHQIANDGRAVVVARATAMTLAARADIVRAFVTASADTRAKRMAAAQGIAVAAAASIVATADQKRQHYFRRFDNVIDELPTHYDVVVDADVPTAERTVCAARGWS